MLTVSQLRKIVKEEILRESSILDKMASQFVGDDKTQLFFVSNIKSGRVVAVFTSEYDAVEYALPRRLYVEGPGGEIAGGAD